MSRRQIDDNRAVVHNDLNGFGVFDYDVDLWLHALLHKKDVTGFHGFLDRHNTPHLAFSRTIADIAPK